MIYRREIKEVSFNSIEEFAVYLKSREDINEEDRIFFIEHEKKHIDEASKRGYSLKEIGYRDITHICFDKIKWKRMEAYVSFGEVKFEDISAISLAPKSDTSLSDKVLGILFYDVRNIWRSKKWKYVYMTIKVMVNTFVSH